MGLESLKGRKDRCNLWWNKANNVDAETYPRFLLDSEWRLKPHRGRQRKTWRKVISEFLLQLNLDSQKLLAEDYKTCLWREWKKH